MSEEENMGHNTGREWRRVRLVCGGEIIRKGGGSHAWPKAARRRQEGGRKVARSRPQRRGPAGAGAEGPESQREHRAPGGSKLESGEPGPPLLGPVTRAC